MILTHQRDGRKARDDRLTAGGMQLVVHVIRELDGFAEGRSISGHGNPFLDAYDLLAETLPVMELVAKQLRRE